MGHLKRHAVLRRGLGEAGGKGFATARPGAGRRRSSSRLSVARPAAVASGLPESVPAWYTSPAGATAPSGRAARRRPPPGRPPPMIFPRMVRSGVTPSRSCAPPRATRNPEITSSNTSSAPAASAAVAQEVEEAPVGRHEAHVGRVGLAHERGQLALGERALHRVAVVPRHHRRVGRLGRGHAGAGRDALGGEARARLGQEAVHVAVVGAGELQHRVAARWRRGPAGSRSCSPRCPRRSCAPSRPRAPAATISAARSLSASVGAP